MSDPDFQTFEYLLADAALRVEQALAGYLSDRELEGEISRPQRLLAAMRHGVFNGGKRLRPFLVIHTAALFDAGRDISMPVASALECVHCYSLIHDDLPAMDDDDLRRGQPTVHRAFDEATAILSGDSLLTLAFDILSGPLPGVPAERQLALVSMLARAAGIGGMAGGQALDLQAERQKPDEADILRLQAMKTGALLRFACEAGAVVAGAGREDRERMAEFGSAIGLAFQLADDILDVTADAAAMGKATGKDAEAGKATLVGLHGMDWARSQLDGLLGQAQALLSPYGEKAAPLRDAARFIGSRRN